MKKYFFLLLILPLFFTSLAQRTECIFKKPVITIHFGTGNIQDVNKTLPYNYQRVPGYCPTDGHYSYTSFTSRCFRDDWFTLDEDHTPGDLDGNMMLVNASNNSGVFLSTEINNLKGGTTYEFGVWMMNVCKISEKCPFPLLPKITIRLETTTGKLVAQFTTGELSRRESPGWTPYRALFTTPATPTALLMTMIDNPPGGCGNDFALDDITFRECVPPKRVLASKPRPVEVKKPAVVSKPVVKSPIQKPVKRQVQAELVSQPAPQATLPVMPAIHSAPSVLPAPPPILATRANPLVERIEAEAGEIKLDLYDNGDIDGDTVSIYHNNVLLVSRARLSQKPISFTVSVDSRRPHHELIMVANNLGAIPPNTSLMVITAGGRRHEVFISSSEQKNAKVVLELKK